jgi:hypothetical protein
MRPTRAASPVGGDIVPGGLEHPATGAHERGQDAHGVGDLAQRGFQPESVRRAQVRMEDESALQ